MEARPLLNVPVLKNLRELRPYHTQDQFSLPSVTRLTISVLRIWCVMKLNILLV